MANGIFETGYEALPDYSSTITGTDIPEYVAAAGREIYEQARSLAGSPMPLYTGSRTATYGGSRLTPQELMAQNILMQGAQSYQPFLEAAYGVASGLGQGYDAATTAELMGAPYAGMSPDTLFGDYTGATREELVGGPFTIEQAQPFLDVYQRAVDPAVAEVERQIAQQQIQQRAQAASAGAFGGSRAAVQDVLTGLEGAGMAGDLRAQAAAEGLEFATQQAERDRAARFGAEQAMRGQFESDRAARFNLEDLMRGQFIQDREARFGAEAAQRSAFETEEASRLRAASELQSYAPLIQGMQEQAAAGLLTSGEAQRRLDQAALDLAYADYLQQATYPFEMLNFALGALQGVPYQTAQYGFQQGVQYGQTPSLYGQTLGGLGSLASAYYMSQRT